MKQSLPLVQLRVTREMFEAVGVLAQRSGIPMSVIWKLAMKEYLANNRKDLDVVKVTQDELVTGKSRSRTVLGSHFTTEQLDAMFGKKT